MKKKFNLLFNIPRRSALPFTLSLWFPRVVPCMLTMQMLVPLAFATTVYGQPIPESVGSTMMWLAASVLIALGIVILARTPGIEAAYAADT